VLWEVWNALWVFPLFLMGKIVLTYDQLQLRPALTNEVTVASRDIYVLVCVSMDLLWYRVVMTCGFLADVVCVLYFVYLWFCYVRPASTYTANTYRYTEPNPNRAPLSDRTS
jgi:hypothetical protein